MDGKRYYWFRFKEDFFQDKRIKRLRQIADGDTYTIIFLKLQLKALKTDGYLFFDNVLDDFSEELALDIDESPDNVRFTIEYLLRVGLLEVSPDGKQYYLTELKNLIGSETASAQRVREYRLRQKEEKQALQCNTNVTELLQCNTDVTKTLHCNAPVTDLKPVGSVEIEIEKEIDIDKEKNIKRESKKSNAFCPPTLEEVKAYCEERNNSVDAERFIDFYAAKGWMIGRNKMKDWKAAVRTWERADEKQWQQPPPPQQHSTRVRNFCNIDNSYTADDIRELEEQLLEN